jgi:hypothetical protein
MAFGKFSEWLVNINHKSNTSLQYIICDIMFYNDLHLEERINNYSNQANNLNEYERDNDGGTDTRVEV